MQFLATNPDSQISQAAALPALEKKMTVFSTVLEKIINFIIRVWHLITCNYFKNDKVSPSVLQNTQKTELFTVASKESIESVSGSHAAVEVGAQVGPQPLQPFPLGHAAGAEVSVNSFALAFEKFESKDSEPVMDWVYVLTNEYGLYQTYTSLGSHPEVPNGCHIGFSGLHNFDIIAKRKSKYALLFDINPDNTKLLRNVLKILKLSSSREEFVRYLQACFRDLEARNDRRLKGVCYSMNLLYEIDREGSWLNTDDGFNHVREMALREDIFPITQNITNSTVFDEIASILKERSIKVDTLYLSNICNYMKTTQNEFTSTARSLINNETIVIHCVARMNMYSSPEAAFSTRSCLIQSTILGSELTEDRYLFSMGEQDGDRKLVATEERKRNEALVSIQTVEASTDKESQKSQDVLMRKNLADAGILGLFD
jgi:hypothetical protein